MFIFLGAIECRNDQYNVDINNWFLVFNAPIASELLFDVLETSAAIKNVRIGQLIFMEFSLNNEFPN